MTKNWRIRDKPAALYHAIYEIEMLTHSVQALCRSNMAGTPDANAWLETFAIHVRNLNEFFAEREGDADYMKPHHFVPWTYSYDFDGRLAGRASSQVAHLTYNRERPEDKSPWPIESSFRALSEQSIAFLRAVAAVESLMSYETNGPRIVALLDVLPRINLTAGHST